MSSGAPQWVDAALVQRAVQAAGEGAVRVLGVEAENMNALRGNPMSSLFRLRVRLQREQSGDSVSRSFVLKCESDEGRSSEDKPKFFFFQREITSYTRIIPQIQEMLERAAPGRFPPLAPHCFQHGEEPNDFLILDDLCEKGFRMADHMRGLGLRHSLLAIAALARFHAASASLLAINPSISTLLPNPMKFYREQNICNVVELCFQNAAEACRGWSDFPIEYSEYLERIKSSAYDKFLELAEAIPGVFNVINHADYWTDNIMYRYENGVPVETRMIDFQYTSISSPTVDLIRFLYSSLAEDILENHFDLLIREYHAALKESLELLEMSSPSLENLWKDLNSHGFFALSLVFTIPLAREEREKAAEMAKATGNEGGITTDVFNIPRISRWLKHVLVNMQKRGWLCENEVHCNLSF